MSQEEKLEKIIAGVVEVIVSDASLPGDIKSRIGYKIVNDDEFRISVLKIVKAVLAYCSIAAEDKTGVALMTRSDAQLPRTTDSDALLIAKRLVIENTAPDSVVVLFASTNKGVGVEIFKERIKVLLEQLN